MINKDKSPRWVKIVAWVLAISFGLGMTLLFALPTPNQGTTNSASTSPKAVAPVSASDAAAAAVGQGDLAMKSDNIDQAISFYENAYRIDKKDKAVRNKLADAYKKYLQLSPDGANAEKFKTALDNL